MSARDTRPPFDASIERAMDELRHLVVTSMTQEDIPTVRAIGVPISEAELTFHGAFERHTLVASSLRGAPDVPVVAYIPVECPRQVPVILHFHGGGLIAGTADSDMPAMAELAGLAGCAVVSVEYRLAPENPYPAALEDATTALEWLAGENRPWQLDPARIIVAGVSAGGGLAAATVLHARDHGGPAIAGALLMCPMLDHRSDSVSARQMEGHGSWDRVANASGWEAYLGSLAAADSVPAYASAARASSLAGLPPTFVDVGTAETFRDECVEFASRAWAEGGDVELHVWPGGAHAFDFLAPWAPLSRDARAARIAWLRRLLARI